MQQCREKDQHMDWKNMRHGTGGSQRSLTLKKLRVRKVNTSGHAVLPVAARSAWDSSTFVERGSLQPTKFKFTEEEHQQRQILQLQHAMPPIGKEAPLSGHELLVSHRFMDSSIDSYPIMKHSLLFSKAKIELQGGLRPQDMRLFQLPMRLIAATMQEQHPTAPVVSPLHPQTPLASYIRRNRRRPTKHHSLHSVLAMSPGSPESPARSACRSASFSSPLAGSRGSRGTAGMSGGFRKKGSAARGSNTVNSNREDLSSALGSDSISFYSPDDIRSNGN